MTSMNEAVWRKGLAALGHGLAGQEIIDAALDLVALWENPKIMGLSRADRNATIEKSRNRLIVAARKLRA